MKKLSHILVMLLLMITCVSYAICGLFVTPNIPASTTESVVKLPIIMYHLVLKDESRAGNYIVSPKTFREDMDYILKNGYTPVNFEDVKKYVYEGVSLPQKPIMITFDDGFYNNYCYIYPIIKEKNIKIVLSVIGNLAQKYSEIDDTNPYYAYCNWQVLKEMYNSNLVEIQNHSYNLHSYSNERKGVLKKVGETNEEYIKVIYEDFTLNHKSILENTGSKCDVLCFPFGLMTKSANEVVKNMGYSGSFSCTQGVNNITKNPDCLFGLKRYNRRASYTTKEFFENQIKF